MKTAVVEKRATFGGTCLNIGCIPSKAMLNASELYEEAGHKFGDMGIKVGKPSVDLAAMLKYKEKGVEGNVKGVEYLFKKNKIETFRGAGRIDGAGQGRGEGRRRQDADAGDEEHRHRHRLGRGAAARYRHRRKARRVVDRRARSRQGAAKAPHRRRRHHRARARLGVAAARRRGDDRRIPRSHFARHRSRDRQPIPPHAAKAGACLQTVVQGHRGRCLRQNAEGEGRAGCRRRRCGDASKPISFWWRSAACLTPKALASKPSA